MRRLLPELVALPLLPLLIAQGRRTRRVTPRLPEARGLDHGIAGAAQGGAPFSLLAVGESPIAGVGVETHAEAITAQLANVLAIRLQRPVQWRACGINGITVSEGLQRLVPQIPEAAVDLLFVAFGVNDTTAFRRTAVWRSDLEQLLHALEQRCAPRFTLLSGVPPMSRFPALPQPLRWVLGMKARALDEVARRLAATASCTLHIPLTLDPHADGMMARDGYHPSASGCIAWAQALAEHYHAAHAGRMSSIR